MSDIPAFANIPEISFIDNTTIDDIDAILKSSYKLAYQAATGQVPTMADTDVATIILKALVSPLYQIYQLADRDGKQDLLKYAYGSFLDNLALMKKITRDPAAAAKATFRFTLSAAQPGAVGIPVGTRITGNSGFYFATDVYAEIPAGELTTDVSATCQTAGEAANGIPAGAIATLVDPIAYVATVSNVGETGGGSDEESDDALTERIYEAPSAFSVAGPVKAYEYWAKKYRDDIDDVLVTSPQGNEVDIYCVLSGGQIPDADVLTGLETFLSADDIRPMTDVVKCMAPTEVPYDITLTYYINSDDASKAATIQSAVNSAITDYVSWQRKIGRDINPSELTRQIIAAGAKRVEITAPAFQVTEAAQIPACSSQTVTYGGLEND
jgi:phage-related baseplate assembly protein